MRRKSTKFKPMNFLENFLAISFSAYLSSCGELRPLLILSFILSHLGNEAQSRTCIEFVEKNQESIFSRISQRDDVLREQTTLIHRSIRLTGVQILRRRRSIFINGSALTSPGTCVTVNAHSTERCGTLSLSMTDITHSRTFRRLLRIPYGNVARPISRTVHL